ncbi:hypothetical protein B0H19DRAFT_1197830 [Mycena capillaripes]|nr:hypothetical protein B0H19DRAFT_1197830 [Mycena capillaripes]
MPPPQSPLPRLASIFVSLATSLFVSPLINRRAPRLTSSPTRFLHPHAPDPPAELRARSAAPRYLPRCGCLSAVSVYHPPRCPRP